MQSPKHPPGWGRAAGIYLLPLPTQPSCLSRQHQQLREAAGLPPQRGVPQVCDTATLLQAQSCSHLSSAFSVLELLTALNVRAHPLILHKHLLQGAAKHVRASMGNSTRLVQKPTFSSQDLGTNRLWCTKADDTSLIQCDFSGFSWEITLCSPWEHLLQPDEFGIHETVCPAFGWS